MKIQNVRRPISYSLLLAFHMFQVMHLFMSPVLILFAANQGIINGSFVIFVLLFITSLFFGRAFCSWICPGGGIQDMLTFVLKKKSKNGKLLKIKYLISSIWLSSITVLYLINGFKLIDLTFGIGQHSLTRSIILSIGAIAIIFPFAFIFGKWASCKYICWMAPILIFGTKLRDYLHFPSLQLVTDKDKCSECKICEKKCPMNLPVMNFVKAGKIKDDECVLCGSCVDSCKQNVIKYTIIKE